MAIQLRTRQLRTRVVLAGSAVTLTILGVGVAQAATAFLGTSHVGRQSDGSVVTSTNQRITPAGTQVEFAGRPTTVRVRPDGKTATALNSGGALLVVTDLASGSVVQQYSPGGSGSFDGLVYSPDGSSVFASRSNGTILRASVAADGTLSDAVVIPLAATNGNPYPGGLAIAPDGKTLYAALSRSNALAVIDLPSNSVTATIPVGNAPHDVVLAGAKAYVTNQGGRPATAGDLTNDSSGTPIVADPVTGGARTGTVSVVDLAARSTVRTIPVGLQPTGAHLAGHDLFVANSSSDTVSVIDTTADRVATTIDIKPIPRAPLGSQPNAVTLDDQHHLAVSLGRNNAVALYDWESASHPTKFLGLIPVGWYPSSLATDPAHRRLVVANTKGVGALGPVGADGGHRVQARIGSLSLVPVPTTEKALKSFTDQVLANTGLDGPPASQGADQQGRAPAMTAIPQRIGDPSPIKHIFYVIKENRTYDQVMGDDPRGNGDPTLTTFGAQVTPNQHALAKRFPLMDNFYASGDLSADGHQWDMQANVPDYLEKAFGGFARSYPYNGGDSLAYEQTGFLWGNALAHRKSVADFGEYAPKYTGPKEKFGTWTDWYHDYLKLSNQETGEPHVPVGAFQTHADVPQLDRLLMREYPNFDMNIPDQYREVLFQHRFEGWVKGNNLPDLVLIHLPNDHTAGSAKNEPTPAAMNADNDLALGKMVDLISHSKYWKDSAMFVTEDDSQAGTDHVDGHRTNGYVVSPYARSGLVDSHYWSQTNMVRTIEQILGLPPMNQMDLAASPMRDLFTDTPDLTPYEVKPNLIPLDTMNGSPAALTATNSITTPATGTPAAQTNTPNPEQRADLRRQWETASSSMGFGRHDGAPDQVDHNLLNHAIWYASTGYTRPYPGEKQVLSPTRVTRDPASTTAHPDSDG